MSSLESVGGDPAIEFRHETLPRNDGRPMLLTVAADGALWCSRTDDRLSRRDAAGGHTVIDLAPGSAPYGIAAAPDGEIWFTAPGLDQIGRVTAAGDITVIDLAVPDARAAMLTVDADGRVSGGHTGRHCSRSTLAPKLVIVTKSSSDQPTTQAALIEAAYSAPGAR